MEVSCRGCGRLILMGRWTKRYTCGMFLCNTVISRGWLAVVFNWPNWVQSKSDTYRLRKQVLTIQGFHVKPEGLWASVPQETM